MVAGMFLAVFPATDLGRVAVRVMSLTDLPQSPGYQEVCSVEQQAQRLFSEHL